MEKVEILAPAGNFQSFKAAIENGADAVYMGLDDFNARKMTENFDIQQFKEAILYAHKRNAKVYLTMNILMYTEELEEALKKLIILYKNGLDGVIVQDLGLARLIHKVIPNLSLHASTQMTVHNLKQVKFLESIGFSRVVLAREMTIKEIENICKNTKMEVEVFVHGALCVCYSGQCLLSSVIGKRSGNRGSCAQPCRTKYSLSYKDSKNKIIKDLNLLSKKDIYGIEHVESLIKAGVKSLKIEGRNKVPEYVATCVSKYRKKVDKIEKFTQEDEKELLQIFNRSGKSYGYLEKVENNINSISTETAKNTGLVLGKVLDKKNNFVKIKLNEKIDLHDGIEIHGKNVVSTIVTCIRSSDFKIKNCEIDKNEIVWLGDINKKVEIGDIVYKTSSKKLNDKLKYTYEKDNSFVKKSDVNVNLIIKENTKMYANMSTVDNKYRAEAIIDYIPVEAKTVEIEAKDIEEKFRKVKDTVYNIKNMNISLDKGLYIPVSKINELRRTLYSNLEEKYIENKNVDKCYEILENEIKKIKEIKKKKFNYSKNVIKKTAYIYKFDGKKEYKNIYENYSKVYIEIEDFVKYEKEIISNFAANEIYIVLPNIVLANLDKYIDKNLENLFAKYPNIRGLVIGNIGYLEMLKSLKIKYDLEIIADYNLNATNIVTFEFLKEYGVDKFTLMPDLDEEIIKEFISIYNVEIIQNYVTVMTSRYCVLGTFLSANKEKCEMPCQKAEYKLIDFKGEDIYIVSKPLDCIMRLVKNIKETKYNNTYMYINKRENIL